MFLNENWRTTFYRDINRKKCCYFKIIPAVMYRYTVYLYRDVHLPIDRPESDSWELRVISVAVDHEILALGCIEGIWYW